MEHRAGSIERSNIFMDFYKDIDEFEEAILELKDKLKASIMDEWLDKMAALEKENAELRYIKENFESIKQSFEEEKRACQNEMNKVIATAEKNARNSRFKDLLKDLQSEYWRVNTRTVLPPKCDKCDENRNVHYITPLGREAKEKCVCSQGKIKYIPEKLYICEIELKDGNGNNVNAWYKPVFSLSDDEYLKYAPDYLNKSRIVNDQSDYSVMKTSEYKWIFTTEEKCKAFCDYLNEEKCKC